MTFAEKVDAFLNVASGLESEPQLAMGLADKLRVAMNADNGLLPTAKPPVVGRQLRLLAGKAGLSGIEAFNFSIWVEENYGSETLTRFEQLLTIPSLTPHTFSGPVVAPPAAAPAAAPAPLAPLAASFAAMAASGMAPAPAAPPAPLAMTEQLREDVTAQGFDAGTIATLTFAMHTARLPPEGHEEVKYGVDPTSMTRLYKAMKNAHGTLLWDLVTSDKTTFREFQDHFHAASQATAQIPAVSQRLAAHWMEMQRYFDSATLVRAYYRRLLTTVRGRGIPSLVHQDILLLVMSAELGKVAGAGAGGAGMDAAVERMTKLVDSQKELLSSMKETVGTLKSDVNNIKADLKSMKDKLASMNICTYCGQPGHSERNCHKKKKDKGEDIDEKK